MPQRLTRRQFLELAVTGSTLAIGVGGAYSFAVAPNDLVLERVTVATPLPVGLRIGVVSDLHLVDKVSRERVERAVALLSREAIDIAVILGDYSTSVNGRAGQELRNDVQTSVEILGTLQAPLGTYAILGNHDIHRDLRDIEQIMRASGLAPLNNAGALCTLGGQSFGVVGLADAIQAKPDFAAARQGLPSGVPILGLVHEPDAALTLSGAALVLSGHSHGGQVRLPWIGAPILPEMGRRFPWGLRRSGSTLIYTSRGVGMVPPRLRVNCPPEVTVITIVNDGGQQPMPPMA